MTLLDRVKQLCASKGISQGKLEKEIGISNGASYKWKTSSPSMEILEKLSNYFNVTVDYLVSGEEKEGGETYYLNDETAKMAQDIFENKELRVLFDAARDASPEDLQTVHSMLLALKRKEQGNID
ncbi:MAG: helix-turn-helix domain-containing protein [Agathobacter sp.]